MDFKKLLPHLIAFAALLALSTLFFAPNAFSGKTLAQSDNTKARGMSAEIQKYRDSLGIAPLWTNAAFGGMPAFQVHTPAAGNMTEPLSKALFFNTGASGLWTQVFIAMFCLYLLMIALQVDWRVALLGAVAYGLTTYNVDILEAGHTTKMKALAMAPGMLAGAIYAFRGRYLLGAGMLALFTAMQITVNHVQITYYTFILIGILWLVKLIFAFQHKDFVSWGKALGFTILAMSLGFLANTSKLWPTFEYSKETIRGKSELKAKADKGDGLDKDYAFGWSYGIGESLTLLVPHAFGGGAGENYEGTAFYKKIYPLLAQQASQSGQNPKNLARQQTAGLMYSGSQPFVGTAIYFGAVIVFLFLLGAFLVPGEAKVWLVTSALVMLSFAWGKNFFMNDVFYSILPMFNKFRAVTMALGLSQLCFAALAALGLQQMLSNKISVEKKKRSMFIAGGISLGLLLLAMLIGGGSGPNDSALSDNRALLDALESTRASLVKKDVLRSFIFIAMAFGVLWFYLKGTLKAAFVVGIMIGLAVSDHWLVATRTLTPSKYEAKAAATAAPKPMPADKQIWSLAKDDPHYRVLDLARGGLTGNAIASYFHKSISGYHAAKLQRYQEVVDKYLDPKNNTNINRDMPKITGMLNAKYIITQKGQVQPNTQALGNAWFVRDFNLVDNADSELEAIGRLDARAAAVLQKKYAGDLDGFKIQSDSTASIRLTAYNPDKMEYSYSAATDQLALFSEMYYPPSKGWKVTINGTPVESGYMKADYFLRALRLPAAQNGTIVMSFEPQSFYTGKSISMVTSILTVLLFIVGLFLFFKNNGLSNAVKLDNVAPSVANTAKKSSKKVQRRKRK